MFPIPPGIRGWSGPPCDCAAVIQPFAILVFHLTSPPSGRMEAAKKTRQTGERKLLSRREEKKSISVVCLYPSPKKESAFCTRRHALRRRGVGRGGVGRTSPGQAGRYGDDVLGALHRHPLHPAPALLHSTDCIHRGLRAISLFAIFHKIRKKKLKKNVNEKVLHSALLYVKRKEKQY